MPPPLSRLQRIQTVDGAKSGPLEGCLRAILASFDRDRNIGDMPQWPSDVEKYLVAADHAIKAVAVKSGLEARELHPPDAAPLPSKPPEFDLHWRDSYLPFVREAINRDEPILAYGGWPANAYGWGIITAIDEQNRCSGHTCAEFTAMTGPGLLVYVFSEKK